MSGIMVSKERREAFKSGGGGDRVFPEGEFIGTIEKVETRPFPDFIGKALAEGATNRGYSSGDGTIMSVWLGDNEPIGDSPSPGKQKFFLEFVIEDGKAQITDGAAIPEASWQMERDAVLLNFFAEALGAVEEVTFEGKTYVTTVDGLVDSLIAGDFNGARVGFKTYHRKWTSKGGKSGTEVKIAEFFTAE